MQSWKWSVLLLVVTGCSGSGEVSRCESEPVDAFTATVTESDDGPEAFVGCSVRMTAEATASGMNVIFTASEELITDEDESDDPLRTVRLIVGYPEADGPASYAGTFSLSPLIGEASGEYEEAGEAVHESTDGALTLTDDGETIEGTFTFVVVEDGVNRVEVREGTFATPWPIE